MIEQPIALAAAIAGIAALAFWLESRFGWARSVSATLLVILFGAILSNTGLVPVRSPVYDGIFGPVTSLAIAWLLISVRLADLRNAGPRMFGAFGIGVAGTAVGAVAGTLVLAGAFGDEAWKLAGVTTGTYSGGGLNFVAVGRGIELPPSWFAAAAAADNLMTAVWFPATMLIPLWLTRRDRGRLAPAVAPDPAAGTEPAEGPRGGRPQEESGPAVAPEATLKDREPRVQAISESASVLRALDLSVLFALGFALIWASERLTQVFSGVPSVLWLTTLALAAGQIPAIRRLSGSMLLGTVALHFFFALIGIGARVSEIVRVGPEVLYLMAIAVGVHGLVIYGIGRLVRLDPETLSVASQAAVGGPTTAMALSIARGWRSLILPGMAAGLLGYAVGNYLGFAVAYLVRGLIG